MKKRPFPKPVLLVINLLCFLFGLVFLIFLWDAVGIGILYAGLLMLVYGGICMLMSFASRKLMNYYWIRQQAGDTAVTGRQILPWFLYLLGAYSFLLAVPVALLPTGFAVAVGIPMGIAIFIYGIPYREIWRFFKFPRPLFWVISAGFFGIFFAAAKGVFALLLRFVF